MTKVSWVDHIPADHLYISDAQCGNVCIEHAEHYVKVHVVDGTYELFRHYYAMPGELAPDGQEVAATRGVVTSLLGMLEEGVTHLGVATDHVIESFRNDLWPGYKNGAGIEPALRSQFTILENALAAMGVVVWPMVEYEADDALGTAAVQADSDERVEQVIICTPDKDLGQCVRGQRIVQLDRRRRVLIDDAGVEAKFGVKPESIPDYLALVGDSSDGYPGLRGWGAKSASVILAEYRHLESIPRLAMDWTVTVRGARTLASTLQAEWENAKLFRHLATIVTDAAIGTQVDDLCWSHADDRFAAISEYLGSPELVVRADTQATRRAREGGV